MAGYTKNTMVEGLGKIAKDLTGLMQFPDADMQFLTDLQTRILGYLQQSNSAQPQNFPPPDQMAGVPSPGQPGPAGLPPELAAAGVGNNPTIGGIVPAGGPPPVPGIAAQPAPPNPDELRRIMSM